MRACQLPEAVEAASFDDDSDEVVMMECKLGAWLDASLRLYSAAVLCCVVLRGAVLCGAMLCCAALYSAVLCCTLLLCCAVLRGAVLRCAVVMQLGHHISAMITL